MKRPKTAYGVLAYVQRLILAEPLRYDQHQTLLFDAHHGYEYLKAPPCGTVGCRAGWATMVISPDPRRIHDPVMYAQRKLGLTDSQGDDLFGSSACGATIPQTRAHARAGAKGIATFLKRYSKQLRATRIGGPNG